MKHLIRLLAEPRHLNIAQWTRTGAVDPDGPSLRLVLGWLVHIAMQDGMTKLSLGVNRETQEPWMKFFGPRWYRQPIWWNMVPPEAYCYPTMLQVCLTLADLEYEFPIRGVIEARKGKKRLHLGVQVREIDSFEISWEKEYAIDQDQALGNLPSEEEHADDRKGNGDAAQPA